MECQLASPSSKRFVRTAACGWIAASIVCLGALSAVSAPAATPADAARPADTLVAWRSAPLPIVSQRSDDILATPSPTARPQVTETKEAPRAPVIDPIVADGLWQGAAPASSRIDGTFLLEADGLPLGAQGRSPMGVLLATVGGPVAAEESRESQNTSSISTASVANVGAASPTRSSSFPASRSEPAVIWAVAAIVACGLGVAGLRGPFLATRLTPVKKGWKP